MTQPTVISYTNQHIHIRNQYSESCTLVEIIFIKILEKMYFQTTIN